MNNVKVDLLQFHCNVETHAIYSYGYFVPKINMFRSVGGSKLPLCVSMRLNGVLRWTGDWSKVYSLYLSSYPLDTMGLRWWMDDFGVSGIYLWTCSNVSKCNEIWMWESKSTTSSKNGTRRRKVFHRSFFVIAGFSKKYCDFGEIEVFPLFTTYPVSSGVSELCSLALK